MLSFDSVLTEDAFWDFVCKGTNPIHKGSAPMTLPPPQPLPPNSITSSIAFQHEFLGGTRTSYLWQRGWCGGNRDEGRNRLILQYSWRIASKNPHGVRITW